MKWETIKIMPKIKMIKCYAPNPNGREKSKVAMQMFKENRKPR